MVIKQGDIIKFDFNPALVVSNNAYNKYTNLLIVLPITNADNNFPLHIKLDERTITTGVILCEHIKSIDKTVRNIKKIEVLPKDIFEHVIAMIHGEIDMK